VHKELLQARPTANKQCKSSADTARLAPLYCAPSVVDAIATPDCASQADTTPLGGGCGYTVAATPAAAEQHHMLTSWCWN